MEDLKQKLRGEGFRHVYEWQDKPNTQYPEHRHKGRVSFYVTKGSVSMDIDGKEILIKEGERMDVPTDILHTGTVGPEGCTYIVGEEIEGDS